MRKIKNDTQVRTQSSSSETLMDVVGRRISRRDVLFGTGATCILGGWISACEAASPATPNTAAADTGFPKDTELPRDTGVTTPVDAGGPDGQSSVDADASRPIPLALGFAAVAKSMTDNLLIPAGYRATVLYRLGDPIATGVSAFANDGSDAPESFALRSGDHHDGMHFFCLGANGKWDPKVFDRALLAINHEAITPAYLHPNGPTIAGAGTEATRTNAGEVIREMNAHGVSIIEISRNAGVWSYKPTSLFNRRITSSSVMELSGPAAGSTFMVTKFSSNGRRTRGTINNCANGYTPWGTYLTCEENWAGYFRRSPADNAQRSAKERTAFARYGVAGTGRELWSTITPDSADQLFGRWNAERTGASADGSDDYRNIANTFGWVVEIDPFAPSSLPTKRTAMGRFAHEGAWLGAVTVGRPIVMYMGCDSRNEYIYKFVSKALWSEADIGGGLVAGSKYLDEGTLYVAKFDADGTGRWLELAFGKNGITAANAAYPFADEVDVAVHTRLAADAVGATKMDRPEWGAVNPTNGDVYFTLTNTNATARPIERVDAANPRFYNDPKGADMVAQKGNPNGHIIRIAEAGKQPAAATFTWDIYLFGARASADAALVNLSGLTPDNDFSSPDGLFFSEATKGLLWIETDDGAYTDQTNCMLLAAIPGAVGDGGKQIIANSDGAVTQSVETRLGKKAGATNLRRFLVGPRECEITGITESPDGTALFVNIQHPGEETKPKLAEPTSFGSHWPDGGNTRPRSATIVITREDGGVVGAT
jgi:uncharacterized protein